MLIFLRVKRERREKERNNLLVNFESAILLISEHKGLKMKWFFVTMLIAWSILSYVRYVNKSDYERTVCNNTLVRGDYYDSHIVSEELKDRHLLNLFEQCTFYERIKYYFKSGNAKKEAKTTFENIKKDIKSGEEEGEK